jgi:hypothetical protein
MTKIPFAAAGLFVLAIILIVVYLVVPIEGVKVITGVLAMLSMILAALLIAIANLLAIIEIATGKNDVTWKIIWLAIVIILGVFGLAIYAYVARKDLK